MSLCTQNCHMIVTTIYNQTIVTNRCQNMSHCTQNCHLIVTTIYHQTIVTNRCQNMSHCTENCHLIVTTISSDHSNQPLSIYVTLHRKLPLDRNYHIPSDHSNQ